MAARVSFGELAHYGLIQNLERVHLCYNGRPFREEEAEMVVSEGKLRYQGNLYASSNLAAKLLVSHGCIRNGPVQGPVYWRTHSGKLLHELNQEVRSKRGDNP